MNIRLGIISRLADEDDPRKWITVMEADEEVNEQALDAWLIDYA
jgi:hypothetical protein